MLPDGILDFFELTSVGKDEDGFCIHLEEKNKAVFNCLLFSAYLFPKGIFTFGVG
jgi:hypothetical protein